MLEIDGGLSSAMTLGWLRIPDITRQSASRHGADYGADRRLEKCGKRYESLVVELASRLPPPMIDQSCQGKCDERGEQQGTAEEGDGYGRRVVEHAQVKLGLAERSDVGEPRLANEREDHHEARHEEQGSQPQPGAWRLITYAAWSHGRFGAVGRMRTPNLPAKAAVKIPMAPIMDA